MMEIEIPWVLGFGSAEVVCSSSSAIDGGNEQYT